jgi:hypothetical protein
VKGTRDDNTRALGGERAESLSLFAGMATVLLGCLVTFAELSFFSFVAVAMSVIVGTSGAMTWEWPFVLCVPVGIYVWIKIIHWASAVGGGRSLSLAAGGERACEWGLRDRHHGRRPPRSARVWLASRLGGRRLTRGRPFVDRRVSVAIPRETDDLERISSSTRHAVLES